MPRNFCDGAAAVRARDMPWRTTILIISLEPLSLPLSTPFDGRIS